MLAGTGGAAPWTPRNAYLATFVYRASRNAVGQFVIDLAPDREEGQSALLAAPSEEILISSVAPVVVDVVRRHGHTRR
jgi:hypothetical protein